MATRRKFGQNTYRKEAKYTTRDLIHPIVFLKASQKPVAVSADAAWTIGVKPYGQAFAAFDEGMSRKKGGEEAESDSQHIFAIRYDPSLVVEDGDFVVMEQTLYTVAQTKRLRGRLEFLEIYTNIETAIADVTTDNTIPVTAPPVDEDNPFFT